MSSNRVFAIASITALLKQLLNNEIVQQFAHAPVGDVLVTSLPPDRIKLDTEERAQLNLYLYRVTPNTTRQSVSMFAGQAGNTTRLPLALDLHYLLAAYGEKELQPDILLGCAAQLFHDNPMISASMLHTQLTTTRTSGSADPLLEIITASTTSENLSAIKIVPEFLDIDQLSKLWASWQAHARPALTYQVSMALVGDDELRAEQGQTVGAAR